MIVLLAPAKKLTITGNKPSSFSEPELINEAQKLIKELQKYSPHKLQKLMSVSTDIAELNVNRFANWTTNHSLENAKQAILTFTGEVYNGLQASKLNKTELAYAQEHLRILSGLYGILKPLDLIHEYRLEMGTKLKVGKHTNLYSFWGDVITEKLNDSIKNHSDKTIVNLASTEYFKVINTKKLNANVVTPIFKDGKNGDYKVVMMYAKKARGMMANYIIKNKIENPANLIGFNEDGYYFNPKISTDKELVFYRN